MPAKVYIDLEKTTFRPNETVKGKLLWALDKTPKKIELALSWRTRGKGTKDSMTQRQLTWNPSHSAGEQPFELPLPAEPYSIKGRLISITWQLELSAHRVKETFVQEIVVSPAERCIELAYIQD